MSRVLTANDICARSLRMIGAFPVTESAPDSEALREAMSWLDLILADTVGTQRLFKRLNETIGFDLTNGTQSYDLYAELGADLPADGIEFVVQAYIEATGENATPNRHPLEIVTREKFEEVSRLDESGGPPARIHIDFQNDEAPTLRIFPTPAASDTTSYAIKLVCQRYAPNVAPSGVTGSQPSASVLHQMSQAWQRWMVIQLAHDLGSGPVHKLDEQRLTRYAAMAKEAKTRLDAFENREHETTPPICEPWGLSDDWGVHPGYHRWGRY